MVTVGAQKDGMMGSLGTRCFLEFGHLLCYPVAKANFNSKLKHKVNLEGLESSGLQVIKAVMTATFFISCMAG